MIRKSLCLFFIIAILICGGCWNYQGLDQMSIVSGFSIDIDKETGLYKVSFQIVDLSGNVNVEGINAKILEFEGKSLFDACRNAKTAILGKLYFGHAQVVIISDEIAREKDLRVLLDWMLHDSEMRETLKVVVSTEQTASDVLENETLVGPITAFDISKYIQDDNKVTLSTSYKQLYEIYDTLETKGIDLTLPAICTTETGGRTIPKLCGTAVFKGERLAGYLSADESKYFLFAVDHVKGGLLTFPASGEGSDNITLEINESKTDRSYTYKDGKLVIKLEPQTDVFLAECEIPVDVMDKQTIKELEKNAALVLAQRMVQTIQKVQSEFEADIFGFGSLVYKSDYALWQKISKDWGTIFKTLEVQVNAKVNIISSSLIKE